MSVCSHHSQGMQRPCLPAFALTLLVLLAALLPLPSTAWAYGSSKDTGYATTIEQELQKPTPSPTMPTTEPEDVLSSQNGGASEEEAIADDEILVQSGMSLRTSQKALDYYSVYSDVPFLLPATEYNHTLAQMSICMATSANRPIPYDSDVILKPDQYLVKYLQDCGFTDLREDDYDKTPSLYTVATAMGRKEITDGDGESFTLLAVGVCGGNYKKEWLSNVTLGLGERHQGFDSAARSVTDRIFGYLGTHHITGRVKIWIAGFSRAAAVSNVTAANLVDSQAFGKEDIFAYTFATPRTTKNYGSKGYENIFNIIGPMDMVPQVAPAAWGFGRYGNDLTLPGQETDRAFLAKYALVQEGFEEDYKSLTNYNPKVNLSLRLLIGMSEEMVANQEEYDTSAQETILSVLEDKSPQNMLRVMRILALSSKDSSPEKRALEDSMVEFIGRFITSIALDMRDVEERPNMGSIGSRIFHEHIEDLYLMWMNVKQEPEELYGHKTSFTYLIVGGEPKITVEDTASAEVLCRFDASDTTQPSDDETYENPIAIETFDNQRTGEQVCLLAIPHDGDYRVTWESDTPDDDIVAWIIPSTTVIAPEYNAYSRSWNEGGATTGVIYEAHGEEIDTSETSQVTLKSSDITHLLGLDYVQEGWRTTIMRNILRACLILILLRAIVAIINRFGSTDDWRGRFVFSSITMVGLVESEAAYWLFAGTPQLRLFWKALAGVAVLGYCLACRHEGSKQFTRIFAALLFCLAGDLAINFWFLPGVILFGLAHVFFIWLFQKTRPIARTAWFWWAIVSLNAAIMSEVFTRSYATPLRIGIALYIPILLLMFTTGRNQKGNLNLGSFLFVLSDCTLAFYFTHQQYPYAHMAYMALYYLALMIICRSLIDEEIFVAVDGRLNLVNRFREFLKRGDSEAPDTDEVGRTISALGDVVSD